MLSCSVGSLRNRFPFAPPGRVGGRKGFCSRTIPGPGLSQNPALCGSPPTKCQVRIPAVLRKRFSSFSAVVVRVYPAASTHSRFGQRSCPRPLRSRGQLPCRRSRAGSFRRQRPGSRWNRQPRLCRLHSAVRLRRVYLYLPAIPPHLRRGEPRRKCSGRAGAAVPAAGAENVGQRIRRIVAAKTDSLVGTQSRLRFCPSSTAPVGTVFPGLRPRALSLRFSVVTGPVGPDPGGRLCPHTAGLCRRPGVWGLPAVVPSKPAIPHALMLQTASGATLHSLRSFRALWHWQTHRCPARPPPHPKPL